MKRHEARYGVDDFKASNKPSMYVNRPHGIHTAEAWLMKDILCSKIIDTATMTKPDISMRVEIYHYRLRQYTNVNFRAYATMYKNDKTNKLFAGVMFAGYRNNQNQQIDL